MTPAGRARSWAHSPVALLRLDAEGRILEANDTFLAWANGEGTGAQAPEDGAGAPASDADAGTRPDVRGRRLSDLLTVGGRIYWETHMAPILTLQGRVDEVAVELRTPGAPLPVLLSAVARTEAPEPVVDVALFAAQERARFERELVAAREAAEHAAARLQWVQEATAELSGAAGLREVTDALVRSVERHPAVESAQLRDDGALGDAGASLVVPVTGTRQAFGALVVTPHRRPGDVPIDPDALAIIAQQGGVALERARLHEQSESVARELQHAMLTQNLPRRADLEVNAEYRPAVSGLEVGGDWYDAFGLDDTTVALALGDIVGHGLHAATAMGQLRTATQALAAPGLGPAATLELLDQFVRRRQVGFASTLVYAELDTTTGTLSYACAGHLPPLLVRDGGAEYLWEGRSAPLGVPNLRGPRAEGSVLLKPGDVVLLYTDGVVERRDRPLRAGLDQLAAVAAERGIGDEGELLSHFFDAEANQRDDACVLHVAWHGAPASSDGSSGGASDGAEPAAAGLTAAGAALAATDAITGLGSKSWLHLT
ncbi:SpoIIE family protein phosphatase [Puerhibacterium puerhi]|uniref:SpoIIE family protein phosphatase n=1 Tax=Puerhibacterium puerhi TaxID=2692623 RepID=UPI00135C5E0D|nr:SpoIIE family protein phosphatase [Puerhibacterium puerhi]